MVRWNPEPVAVVADERETVDPRVLLRSIVAALAGLDLRAVVATAAFALIAVALLLGLSAQEAAAGSRWCC